MLEKSIETYLRNEVKARDGLCIKLNSEAGLPDRLVLTRDGKHYFVELKRPEGTLSAIQREYHRRLQKRGHTVLVLWDFHDVDKFVNTYM